MRRATMNGLYWFGLVFLGFVLALAALELGRGPVGITVASHEYDDCYGDDCRGDRYENDYSGNDRNRNRGRDRGAFSPGPFRDSPVDAFNGNTVCLPGSTCYGDRRDDQG